jgi:hypothetical protein
MSNLLTMRLVVTLKVGTSISTMVVITRAAAITAIRMITTMSSITTKDKEASKLISKAVTVAADVVEESLRKIQKHLATLP